MVKRTSADVNGVRFSSANGPSTTAVGPSPKTDHGRVPYTASPLTCSQRPIARSICSSGSAMVPSGFGPMFRR